MKKIMKTVALTVVAAIILSLFSISAFASGSEATVELANVTFEEDGYQIDAEHKWSKNWVAQYGGNAEVAADPTDASNKVLKITTVAGIKDINGDAITTAPLYTLGITDNSSVKKLNISYRIKMVPYETGETSARAKWMWSDNFGSVNLSGVAGGEDAVLSGTAKFMFDGNNSNSDTYTTLRYYQYDKDGNRSNSLVPAYNKDYAKNSIYNSWALVNEYLDLETNKYKFTITYADAEYKSPDTLYFDRKATNGKIGTYDRITGINFGILPSEGTGILLVDDIKITKVADLTANLLSDKVTPNSELAIKFSNVIDASTVSAEDFTVADSSGSDVTSTHPVSVRTSGNTIYVKIGSLAFGENYKLTVSNTNISDIYVQKLETPLEFNIHTDSRIVNYLPIASVDFEDESYVIGESVAGKNNWSKSLNKSNDDTAIVVTDPDDASNKVLKIYATAKKSASSTFKYSFDNDIKDDSALLRVSYRMKMPEAAADAPYMWGYSARLGSLNAVNQSKKNTWDSFSLISFNANTYSLLSHYAKVNPKLAQECPENDITPVGGWIDVTKYIDFSNNTQKIELTKYYGNTLGKKTLWSTSYAGNVVTNDGTNKYDVANAILFSIDPQAKDGYATEATLYVDDIEISRVPKYYIADAGMSLNEGKLSVSAKIGRPGFAKTDIDNSNSIIFAVINSDTGELVKAIVKSVDYKINYTSYTKGSGTNFEPNPNATAKLIETDITAEAENITGNVYVKAMLWKDFSTIYPLCAAYSAK